jgi:TM2 domain-containing membrane protein YozV
MFSFSASAEKLNLFSPLSSIKNQSICFENIDSLNIVLNDTLYFKPVKHKRVKAFLLALFLGNFGAHRLYLGTSPKVVVAYSFTLGGIFILPAIDAIMILTVDDISVFENNRKFFMFTPK